MKTIILIFIIFFVLRSRKRGKQSSNNPAPPARQPAESPEVYDLCRRCASLVRKSDWKCKACGKMQRIPISFIVAILALILGIIVALGDNGYLSLSYLLHTFL